MVKCECSMQMSIALLLFVDNQDVMEEECSV